MYSEMPTSNAYRKIPTINKWQYSPCACCSRKPTCTRRDQDMAFLPQNNANFLSKWRNHQQVLAYALDLDNS